MDSEPVPSDTIRNKRSPSITLRVTLVGRKSGREISARALLDSGAEGIIIDHDYTKKHSLTLRTLVNPIPVRNVDGTPNKKETVQFTTIQTIRIKSLGNEHHEETSELYVTSLSDYDIIFGTDWLQAHNPEVDWAKLQLAFTRCPKTCSLSIDPLVIEPKREHQQVAVINALEPFLENTEELNESFEDDAATEFLRLHRLSKALTFSVRAKTTHATEIAARMAPKPSIEHIPPEFHRYASVFSDTTSRALPPHRNCDHAIDIKPGTTMKRNASIYSLTPQETEVLQEWIKDNLAKGYIRPSKSPWACSFFFVQKKDGKLRPVQDYVPLNNITIVNAAPLPLINDLLDKLRGARYFTKFDLCSGYNNIRIKAGDEWKAVFKTSFGLFEPLVMTFGLCNAPATFQTFMNTLFEDLIDQGHVVVYLDDILLFHESQTKLNTLNHEVLRRLQDNSLFLKPEK